jgi:transcriptional regulator with XRE-family HTH domain
MADTPFNTVLAEARAAREMSVKELADRLGMTPGFVRSYEDCAINPTVRTLFLYAYSLGLTVTINRDGVTIDDGDGSTLLDKWIPTRTRDFAEEE